MLRRSRGCRAAALNPRSTKGEAGQSPWNPKNSKDRTIIQKHFEHSRIISSSLSAGELEDILAYLHTAGHGMPP